MTTTERVDDASRGFTLVEVMVSAFLILIVFFGAAQYASRSRALMNHDENRRHAIAIAQSRIETIRRSDSFDTLNTLANRDTTYTVDTTVFGLVHTASVNAPETNAATITVDVSWNIVVNGATVARTLSMTSILGRSLAYAGGS